MAQLMCTPALFLRPERATKPPVLGAHSVASHKLLQPRLMSHIRFNKHGLFGAVTGVRVGTQDACDTAPRTAQGESDNKKIRSTGSRASSTFHCDCRVPGPSHL